MQPEGASQVRRRLLEHLGGAPDAVEAVLSYCESPFSLERTVPVPVLPLAEEPHVADWRRYASGAGSEPFAYLQERIPQLCVPIAKGISGSEPYRAVARRGERFEERDFGGRLQLERPAQLRLHIHEHPAGALPVLSTPCREDFETLSRAFAFRSEPEPIAGAVNARMVAGFINWDRVHAYRRGFEAEQGSAGWSAEMQRVARAEPWRFHDRLMLTCARPYSAVPAAELGLALSEAEWLERSDLLRTEHEFTHYATKRVFGAMSLNLLDETLCDFMGMTLALGSFRSDQFLRFMGLQAFPEVHADGRIHTYTEQLPEAAFPLLCAVTVRASQALERLAGRWYTPAQRSRMLLALCPLTLELLASDAAEDLFAAHWQVAGGLLGSGPEVRTR
jgi:hypothetical protein